MISGPVSDFATSQVVQSGYRDLRAQEAVRTANVAEAKARALASQASAARREADRADERARDLGVKSDRAETAAGVAKLAVAQLEGQSAVYTRIGQVVEQTAARLGVSVETAGGESGALNAASGPAPVSGLAPPVLNSEGQVTGSLIQVSA